MLSDCCKVFELRKFGKRENIVTYGETGDHMYFIVKGLVSIHLPEERLIPRHEFDDYVKEN